MRVRGPSFGMVRTDIAPDLTSATLASLTTVRRSEVVVVQWLAVPMRRSGLASRRVPEDRIEKAKRSEAEIVAAGRVGAWAADRRRARSLVGSVARVLRQATGGEGRLGVRPSPWVPYQIAGMRAPLLVWPSHLNVAELAGLVGWPMSPTPIPGLSRGAARLLPPAVSLPRKGPVVGVSTFPGTNQQIRLGTEGRLRHLHVIGPTGVGKSTLLVHLIEHDIRFGRGVVVFDPIGDLTNSILERVPERRRGDIIVVDPTDAERPVGFNLLTGHTNLQLLVEFVIGVFQRLFASSWGPRSADVLRASLLTLGARPGSTLSDLPELLSNPSFRRTVVPSVMDDQLLAGFWTWFENLSEAERNAVIAPVLNKVRAFLLRPEVVRTLCHPDGTLDLLDVFTKRRVVIVRMAKGLIGQDTAALIGGLIIARFWQTVLSRAAVTPEKRHPVFVYMDEFQDYLRLPIGIGDMLSQARGLGVGVVVAHQHLQQLPESVRRDVLANVGSRVIFQTGAKDARVLASDLEPHLSAEDLRGLGRREIVATVALPDGKLPPVTGRTLPPSEQTVGADAVSKHSTEMHGRPISVTRHTPDRDTAVGRRRRGGGS